MIRESGRKFTLNLLRDLDKGIIQVLECSHEHVPSLKDKVLKTSEWENMIHPEDISSYRNTLERAISSKESSTIRYRLDVYGKGSFLNVTEETMYFGYEGKSFLLSRVSSECGQEATLECQRIMNSILEEAFQDKPLKDTLQDILDKLLETPWLPKGGGGLIFLYDNKENALKLIAHKNMPQHVISTCRYLEAGKCICGKVVQEKQLIFVNHVDERHDITFPQTKDHGHYSLPIMFEGEVVGVLTLYLEAGHSYSSYEVSFLEAICKTIASIIKHKTYEEKLQNLSIAIEHTPDWVVIADRNGTIEYVNQAVEKITGFSREEIIGKTPRIWKSGVHNVKFFENLWKSILSGKPYRSIFINRKKSGEIFYLDQTITPVKDEKGNIVRFISTGKDITESKIYEERIYKLAYYDTLTGLPNRNFFTEKLSDVLNRRSKPFAVGILDLDRLKFINETYSPSTGDKVLKEVAGRISRMLDRESFAARLGSDEFALMIALDSEEKITLFAEKLIKEISKPIKSEGEEVIVTASLGLAMYPNDGKLPSSLMKNAELALIKAKELGRNNYQFYVSEMNTRAVEFVLMSKHMMKALERDEFLVYLQPYVRDKSGKVVGAEALLRWKSEDLGIVSPGKFIPILEDTGLIGKVGEMVIHKACQLLGEVSTNLDISVNISPVNLMNKVFLETLNSILREYPHVNPNRLVLEITENVFMKDERKAMRILYELKDAGFRLAIDDFGTGYSSLNYLRKFPLDRVKIDISYIRDISYDEKDRAIVKSIIDMAHVLGMEVVAEGVEEEAQTKILGYMGCDMYQGFLFYKPMPMSDFLKLVS